MKKSITCLALFLLITSRIAAVETVKVFILAGQSNMEGKASNQLLEHQATAPETAALFSHLRKEGKWITRDDVFIKFLKRHGGLSIGYGSPGKTGLELEFGTVTGKHFKEPVLLIKTAWGGHSLAKNFRPPSAGLPAEALLQKELADAIARTKSNNEKRQRNDPMPTMADIKSAYGSSYRMMMHEVSETLKNYQTLFPALQGTEPEITGFVWFQGWNDMYNGAEKEYAANMKHLIRDVRRDLNSPKLPFVIGVMGQNGSQPAKGAMAAIKEAQASMESVPEFKGNVKAVATDTLVDLTAEQLYPEWRQRFDEWQKVGSDRGYHYLGSAIWFNRIGRALGTAMLELVE